MEVGLQNGTLAIVVANTFFASTVYLIPAAIYSLDNVRNCSSFNIFLKKKLRLEKFHYLKLHYFLD